MILNHEEIKNQNLIEDFNPNQFTNGCYNLTVGEIIDMQCNKNESFVLKPQGMVYVVFKEKLIIPNNIIGFAHVKTSLTKRGIMATNIGLLDPNYKGYISTLLINFGKTDYPINKNDPALKVTFTEIKKPKMDIPLGNNDKSIEEYIVEIKKNIVNLDDKFLNLNAIEESVNKNVESTIFSRIRTGAWIIGGLAFAVSAPIQIRSCTDKKTDTYILNYEAQLNTVTETNNLLLQKLEKVEYKLETFKDSLHQVNENKDRK